MGVIRPSPICTHQRRQIRYQVLVLYRKALPPDRGGTWHMLRYTKHMAMILEKRSAIFVNK